MDIDTIINDLNIPNISASTNFWMMRAKKGVFFNEFIQNKYIAIGWNDINREKLSNNSSKELKVLIKKDYEEKIPGLALNKCYRFVEELKNADVVMIIGLGQIAFATVGDYYEIKNNCGPDREKEIHLQIDADMHNQISIECPYIKRRKISLITIIDTDTANPYLFKALISNRHSLSSLNDYKDEILSTCFDIYNYNGTTNISFRVQKEEKIDSIALSSFIYNTSKLLSDGTDSSISVKVNVHSKGDVILQIFNAVEQNWWQIILVITAIGGGSFKGVEIPSILNIIKKICQWKYDQKIKQEEAREKELENDKRQEELEILRLQKEKTKRELEQEISRSQDRATAIYKSSSELMIKPIQNNIIPLSNSPEPETKQ